MRQFFLFVVSVGSAACGPAVQPGGDAGGDSAESSFVESDTALEVTATSAAPTTTGDGSGSTTAPTTSTSSSTGATTLDSTSSTGAQTSTTSANQCTDPIEVGEGGVGQTKTGHWYSGCFSDTFACETCSAWCAYAGFGPCLFIHTTDGATCEPYGDGTNQLGACDMDVFNDWPPESTRNLRVRCVCDAA